jgi:hypothetical protein
VPPWLLQPEAIGLTALLAAVLAAALVTAALQSATATIGIAIALAAAGDLSLGGATTMVIGANVGSCVAVLRAAAPATADARRAALVDTLLNALAAVLLLLAIFPWLQTLAMLPTATAPDIAGPLHVAVTHTAFNILLAVPRGAAARSDSAASASGWWAPPTASARRCAICARASSKRPPSPSSRRASKCSTWRPSRSTPCI